MKALALLELMVFLPVWRWYLLRLQDGSDEPWGLLPLATALIVAASYWNRRRSEYSPRGAALSLVALAVYGISYPSAPPLARALLAVIALGALIEPRTEGGRVPFCYWGLLVLSLPIVSTLQFYLGYPLRRITSELVVRLLVGVPLRVDGIVLYLGERPLLIDAPCSGIKMLWTALFFSCTLGAFLGIRGWRGWLQLSVTSAVVFVGNLARTAFLVPIEFQLLPLPLPAVTHQLVGVAVLVGVLLTLGFAARAIASGLPEDLPVRKRRPLHIPRSAALMLLLVAAAGPFMRSEPLNMGTKVIPEARWPTEFDKHPAQQLALEAKERRFVESFPGEVRKYSVAGGEMIVRAVSTPTRKLHPAADCLRAVGFSVSPAKAELTAAGTIRGCVEAVGPSGRYRVCEHIEDARGVTFSDVSSWYWAAMMGDSVGPWISTVSLMPAA